jgi:hypothetical protein
VTGTSLLLALTGRAVLAAWAMAAALAVALGLFRRRRRDPRRGAEEAREPARAPLPSREGFRALAALLAAAPRSAFARERAAAAMAALARDALALEAGLDDEAARRALREGALEDSPALRDYIERDYLAGPRARGRRRGPGGRDEDGASFLAKTDEALSELKKLRGARREER